MRCCRLAFFGSAALVTTFTRIPNLPATMAPSTRTRPPVWGGCPERPWSPPMPAWAWKTETTRRSRWPCSSMPPSWTLAATLRRGPQREAWPSLSCGGGGRCSRTTVLRRPPADTAAQGKGGVVICPLPRRPGDGRRPSSGLNHTGRIAALPREDGAGCSTENPGESAAA